MITLKDLGINNKSVYIIAEVAQAHDGSLSMAHSYIDAIADAGADAVKFQTHIADAESTYDEPWRVNFSKQDKTRYDYWKRMEFTCSQWKDLYTHAKERELDFLSSPFSVEALNMLKSIGLNKWKIGSGEIYNHELIDKVIALNQPIFLSSGIAMTHENEELIRKLSKRNIPFAFFQCTSHYPTQPIDWGLNLISDFSKKYECPIGFSDHSGNIFSSLGAVTLGASLLEVHVTFDKYIYGPDTQSSITITKLQELVDGAKQLSLSIESTKSKDEINSTTNNLKHIFGRSLALKYDLKKGHTISANDLILKKPGTGLQTTEQGSIIGKKLKHDKSSKRILRYEDFE